MKRVDNLISIPNKAVDGVDGHVVFFVERFDSQRKGGAVVLGDEFAALQRRLIEKGIITKRVLGTVGV